MHMLVHVALLKYVNVCADISFIVLDDSVAPVSTLRQGTDVSSEEIMIAIGFPTFNHYDLHSQAYVSDVTKINLIVENIYSLFLL